LKQGRIKRIHVNKHVVAGNRKHGVNNPPLTVKVGRDNFRCHDVEVLGPSAVIHSPEKPLKCGAVIWMETTAAVRVK
jgi:hypothetical protein